MKKIRYKLGWFLIAAGEKMLGVNGRKRL